MGRKCMNRFLLPQAIDTFHFGSKMGPSMFSAVRFYSAFYFYGIRYTVAVGGA